MIDKEVQVYECLICEGDVQWNGEYWECKECHYKYDGVFLENMLTGKSDE